MSDKTADPEDFAVPWAFRDGRRIDLVDFDGQREGLICGGCGKPVTYNRGVKNRRSPHFVHKADGSGGCSLMTTTHRIFRDATAALLQGAGVMPEWLLDRMPWRDATTPVAGLAQPETTILDTSFRADVMFTPTAEPAKPLALEVVVTKPVEPEKRDGIHAAGGFLAVLRVERDLGRFAGCQDEGAMFAAAVAEIRASGGFRLVSPRPKVVPAPQARVVSRPGDNAVFACDTDAVTPPGGYARLRGWFGKRPAPAAKLPKPSHWDGRRRIVAYEQPATPTPRLAPKTQRAESMCCTAAIVVQHGNGPRSWTCTSHAKWGWL